MLPYEALRRMDEETQRRLYDQVEPLAMALERAGVPRSAAEWEAIMRVWGAMTRARRSHALPDNAPR